MKEALPLTAKEAVLAKMVDDLNFYISEGFDQVPNKQNFRVTSLHEDRSVKRNARIAALKSFQNCQPIIKSAFDTRRTDQQTERNPRKGLQEYHRSDPFINQEDATKMEIFARLSNVVSEIRKDMGGEPEWHDSYSRQLYDNLNRILRIKQADMDIAQPQLNYLEQLMYARYRLSMEDLEKIEKPLLRKAILAKDEDLLKRARFMQETGGFQTVGNDKPAGITIDGNGGSTQQGIINAIFGNSQFRKDGERTVERTITITIRDNVLD